MRSWFEPEDAGMTALCKVAILGGSCIPFARQNTTYVEASNISMLAPALNGVVDRFDLQGVRLGKVAAGGVLKRSRNTAVI
jgi:acetyl-CoA C-acetyltransferase